MKEKDAFVKRPEIGSNIDIPLDDRFYCFREVYTRSTPNFGNGKEMQQTFDINFRTKLKIYLNKYGEKKLLSDSSGNGSIHTKWESPKNCLTRSQSDICSSKYVCFVCIITSIDDNLKYVDGGLARYKDDTGSKNVKE